MQVYGFLEKAQLENVAGDLANTLTGLVWFNTSASRMKFYDGGAIRSVVDENSTQTITGKTLTGNTIASFSPDGVETITFPAETGNVFLDQGAFTFIDAGHQTTPANPSVGNLRFYSKNDNKLYTLDSDGNEIALGSGGGGLDTYHQDPFDATSASDFSTGNSATFLGGGSLNGALSSETTNPLTGNRSIKYVAGAASLNDYFASPVIDLDPKQRGNDSGITEYFTWSGSTDLEIVVYDVTNGAKLNSVLDVVNNADNSKRYSSSFYPPTNCTQIRYGVHILEAPTNGDEFILDDVELSTNPFVYKELIESQSGKTTQAGSAMTDRDIPQLDLTGFVTEGANIVTVENDGSKATRVLANRDCVVTLAWSCFAANPSLAHYDTDGTTFLGALASSTVVGAGANDQSSVTGRVPLKKGESVRIAIGSTDIANNSQVNTFSFTAEASTEHVVTPAASETESIIYSQFSGFGSTNVRIPYFINEDVDTTGQIIEASNDPVLGVSFTAKEKCVVTATYTGAGDGVNRLGWSLNGDGTNQLTSLATSNRLAVALSDSANEETTAPVTIVLNKGDVLRPHNDTFNATVSLRWHLTLTATKFDVSFLAAVPVTKIDIIEHFEGGSAQSLTTSPATLNLNTNNNPKFSSLDSNQIKVPAGEYFFDWNARFYHNGSLATSVNYLYNATDSVEIERGSPAFMNNINGSLTSFGSAKVTFTKETLIELRGLTTAASGTQQYGAGNTAPNDRVAQIKIHKLR